MLPKTRSLVSIIACLLLSLSIAATAQDQPDQPRRGRKYKAPAPVARLEVTVVRASSGKPVPNAAVIFHPMEGEKDKGNMEMKTNEDGKAIIDVLAIGDTVRLQIVAPGFQTFGEDYKLDTAEKSIVVKLKKPQNQYSIYKPHDQAAATDDSKGTNQSAEKADGSAAAPADGQKPQSDGEKSQSK